MATEDPQAINVRAVALSLAVLHHGLANLAERAIPSNSKTVTTTADWFYDWLMDVNVDYKPPRNGNGNDNRRGKKRS